MHFHALAFCTLPSALCPQSSVLFSLSSVCLSVCLPLPLSLSLSLPVSLVYFLSWKFVDWVFPF